LFKNRNIRALERRLRAERPRPSAQLMRALSPARPVRRQRAFAAALTATLAVSLAAVGGVSYAATAVTTAVKAAAKVVAIGSHHNAANPLGLSSGGDQYRPGFGFGDKNHNHTGPPGVTKGKPGEKTPPAQSKTSADGKAVTVSTSITVDEQAALYFSVVDAKGNPLLITQQGSKVGAGVGGPQTKSIHYVMLVPRTVPVTIRIPANLLVPGSTYRIRVIAVDAQGNKTTTFIPFTAA
jgi:hypothetical protein